MDAPVLISMIIDTENAHRGVKSYVGRRVAKYYDRSLTAFNRVAVGINIFFSSRRSI